MSDARSLKLGLIGDNIAQSRAPLLHRLAGAQNGVAVRYDRLVPGALGQSFEEVLAACRSGGYRGLNITYPYKERVTAGLVIEDPLVRAMGAVNTVIFGPGGPRGFNTDHSGFIAAYRGLRGAAPTGPVLMIGSGGVGRAVGFGLAALGTRELRLVDRDTGKAHALAEALRGAAPDMAVQVLEDAAAGARGAEGLINCTPLGMVGHDGTPLPRDAMAGAGWAFDAIYTPRETQFLRDAGAQGLAILPGWELFFHQGVHAWALFSGLPLDETALRAALAEAEAGEEAGAAAGDGTDQRGTTAVPADNVSPG